MSYTIETPFPAAIYARDRAIGATQFRESVTQSYIASYTNFWAIGRDEVGMPEMQAILDTLGMVGIQILTDSVAYVAGIAASFPGDLPEKYHSAPYDYHVVAPGRIVLDSLKDDWQPETPTEPDATPGQP
jgi:hypothetical protein